MRDGEVRDVVKGLAIPSTPATLLSRQLGLFVEEAVGQVPNRWCSFPFTFNTTGGTAATRNRLPATPFPPVRPVENVRLLLGARMRQQGRETPPGCLLMKIQPAQPMTLWAAPRAHRGQRRAGCELEISWANGACGLACASHNAWCTLII
jgi:hypothetical protein